MHLLCLLATHHPLLPLPAVTVVQAVESIKLMRGLIYLTWYKGALALGSLLVFRNGEITYSIKLLR